MTALQQLPSEPVQVTADTVHRGRVATAMTGHQRHDHQPVVEPGRWRSSCALTCAAARPPAPRWPATTRYCRSPGPTTTSRCGLASRRRSPPATGRRLLTAAGPCGQRLRLERAAERRRRVAECRRRGGGARRVREPWISSISGTRPASRWSTAPPPPGVGSAPGTAAAIAARQQPARTDRHLGGELAGHHAADQLHPGRQRRHLHPDRAQLRQRRPPTARRRSR